VRPAAIDIGFVQVAAIVTNREQCATARVR